MQKYKNEKLTINKDEKKLVNKVAKEMKEVQCQMIESLVQRIWGKKSQKLGNNTPHYSLSLTHTILLHHSPSSQKKSPTHHRQPLMRKKPRNVKRIEGIGGNQNVAVNEIKLHIPLRCGAGKGCRNKVPQCCI